MKMLEVTFAQLKELKIVITGIGDQKLRNAKATIYLAANIRILTEAIRSLGQEAEVVLKQFAKKGPDGTPVFSREKEDPEKALPLFESETDEEYYYQAIDELNRKKVKVELHPIKYEWIGKLIESSDLPASFLSVLMTYQLTDVPLEEDTEK